MTTDPRGAAIALRRREGVPWKIVAHEFGLSRERARQLLREWEAAQRCEFPFTVGLTAVAGAGRPGLTSRFSAEVPRLFCQLGIGALEATRARLEAWPAPFTGICAATFCAGNLDVSFFSGPKLPPVTPAPPPPSKEDPEVEQARRDAQRRAAGLRRGRAATLITGGQGVTAPPNVQRATLLGGGGATAGTGA